MIYELDIANRELRMLKDNYYLMEKLMWEEIHKDYHDQLVEKDTLIKKYRESFQQYRLELNTDIRSKIDREIETIDPKIKAKANYYKNSVPGENPKEEQVKKEPKYHGDGMATFSKNIPN